MIYQKDEYDVTNSIDWFKSSYLGNVRESRGDKDDYLSMILEYMVERTEKIEVVD